MHTQKLEPLEKDGGHLSRDSALQLSRRVDWRFLLPHPHLGRVAYLGPPRQTLLAALRQFSASLTLLPSLDQARHVQRTHASFELVVLRSRRLAAVASAAALLATGGCLYWEIDRLSRFASLRGLSRGDAWKARRAGRCVRDARGCLARLGFCDIALHWHRPNFEACREIIPLHDQDALMSVFSRDREARASRLLLLAGRLLLKTGAFPRLVPYYSVVACKGSTVVATA
jgi:hypothetical protein